MGTFDWVFLAILVVAMPILGRAEHRWLEARVARGDPNARTRVYKHALLLQWPLAIAVLALWTQAGRPHADLGLALPIGVGAWTGWILTLVACALLLAQTILALRRPENMAAVRKQVEPLRALIPHNAGEARLFNVVSITAGICEELLYRGYLIAVFAALFNIWIGVALASLAFGLGHAYQGPRGIVKTGVLGLLFAGLYMLTGSLWAPMLLHAVVDLNSGYLGRRALSNHKPGPDVRQAA